MILANSQRNLITSVKRLLVNKNRTQKN